LIGVSGLAVGWALVLGGVVEEPIHQGVTAVGDELIVAIEIDDPGVVEFREMYLPQRDGDAFPLVAGRVGFPLSDPVGEFQQRDRIVRLMKAVQRVTASFGREQIEGGIERIRNVLALDERVTGTCVGRHRKMTRTGEGISIVMLRESTDRLHEYRSRPRRTVRIGGDGLFTPDRVPVTTPYHHSHDRIRRLLNRICVVRRSSHRMSNQTAGVEYETIDPASRRTFGAAYAAAFAGCLVSSALTYAYVGGPARELNPVLRAVIGAVGLEWMIVLRVVVALGGYWGYYLLGRLSGREQTAVVLGWLTALVYVADGLHDLRVAIAAGVAMPVEIAIGVALTAVVGLTGVVFRPPNVV
jgi:hypothetical protein